MKDYFLFFFVMRLLWDDIMSSNKYASVLKVNSRISYLRNRNRKINKVDSEPLSQTIIITSHKMPSREIINIQVGRFLDIFTLVGRYLMKNQHYYRLGKLATRYNLFLMFKRVRLR